MNRLHGIIGNIQSSGELRLIEVWVNEALISTILLAQPNQVFKEGERVNLLFKETEVAIGTNFLGKISLRNQLECKVTGVERGDLLSSIKLQYGKDFIFSIITTKSADMLALEVGSSVTAFIKTNELLMMESSEGFIH